MLLARASSRHKEIGIRLAIGASRGRLMRQLITEAMVLSLLGAVAGIAARVVDHVGGRLAQPAAADSARLRSADRRPRARVHARRDDVAALLAGLAPALQATKPSLVADLRGEVSASQAAGRRWTLRDVLVAGQMAITALLLVVAALLTRSFVAAQRTNAGFAINRLAVVSTDTSTLKLNAGAERSVSSDRDRQGLRDSRRRVGGARDARADAVEPEQLGDLGAGPSSPGRTRRHRRSHDRLARVLQDDGRRHRRGARLHRRRSSRHAARRDRQRDAGAARSGRARARSARSSTPAAAKGRRFRSSASPPITR